MLKLLKELRGEASESAAGNQKAAAETDRPEKVFKPGWVARIFNVEDGYINRENFSENEIGHFRADQSVYKMSDFMKNLGMKTFNTFP